MKIEINKTKLQQREIELFNNIVELAKKSAANGKEYFTYYYKEGERNGLYKYRHMLQGETNIRICYRGNFRTHTKFYIDN